MLKDIHIFVLSLAVVLSFGQAVLAARRTSPPSGAVVILAGATAFVEFATVSLTVASLPNDNSSPSIFIFSGTYNGQVYLNRTDPLTISLGRLDHVVQEVSMIGLEPRR